MELTSRIGQRIGQDRGAQVIELALALPLLLLVGLATTPVLLRVSDQIILNRAVAVGARYAGKVDAKPSTPDAGCPGTLGRRRSAAAVEDIVIDAAADSGLTLDPADVTVSASPCLSAIGDPITISASVERSFGTVTAAANTALQLAGGTALFPPTFTLEAEAIGYVE